MPDSRKKDELKEIRESRLMGSLVSARADFPHHNEKPTDFFLNLENVNFVSKNIRELKTDKNTFVHQQDETLKEMHKFYQNLYNGKEVLDSDDSRFCEVKQN